MYLGSAKLAIRWSTYVQAAEDFHVIVTAVALLLDVKSHER